MFRSILAGGVLLAGTFSAHAAAPADFSKASCETPAFKSFILARLGHGRSNATGMAMPTRFDYGPILGSTTISNTGTVISCEVTVDLDTKTGIRPVHGRFTATSGLPDPHWNWSPGY